MKRVRLTNRELDELGKRLIVAATPDEGEIDRLVSNPALYDGMLAKIAAMEKPVRERQNGFAWKPVAVAAMAVALFSIPLLALLKLSGMNDPVITRKRVLPYEVREKPFVPETPRSEEPADIDGPRPIPAVIKRTIEPPPPSRAQKSRTVRPPEPEPVFHPIGLAERAEEAAIDGRIVRVEIPRSALFALGVDLPLENGTRAVKADLLVGADGIPRGIRLVE